MTKVQPWVQNIVEEVLGPSKMAVGKVLRHPVHGRVKITDGQYWGERGLSNHWYWRKVDKNGRVYGKTYNGYGWA